MISARDAFEITKESRKSVERELNCIDILVRDAASNGETSIQVNIANKRVLVFLEKLGYEISATNSSGANTIIWERVKSFHHNETGQ